MKRRILTLAVLSLVALAAASSAAPPSPVASPVVLARLGVATEAASDSLIVGVPLPIKSTAGPQRWGTTTPARLALSTADVYTDTVTLTGLDTGTAVLTAWRHVTVWDSMQVGSWKNPRWKPKPRLDSLYTATTFRVVPRCPVTAAVLDRDSVTIHEGQQLQLSGYAVTPCGIETAP
jgi:hypothetical protein